MVVAIAMLDAIVVRLGRAAGLQHHRVQDEALSRPNRDRRCRCLSADARYNQDRAMADPSTAQTSPTAPYADLQA